MKNNIKKSSVTKSSLAFRILFGLVILLYVMTVLLLAPAKEILEFQGKLLSFFSVLKKKLNARIYALVYIVALLSSSLFLLLLFRDTLTPSLNFSAAGEAISFLLGQYSAVTDFGENL